jgi:RHS repeat-associated protein
VTDEAGTIVKVCDPDCTGSNPAYLVTHNGHGDALALWRITGDGSLTLANSYTYSTWGAPTTATHNAYPDLGYRYLYVGAQGVAWDNALGLGLLHMGARHYCPTLGRFLQPDPSALETNLYGYGANSPVSRVDPSGLCWRCALLKATRQAVFTPIVWRYLRLYGGARIHVTSGGYRFAMVAMRRFSRPYDLRNYNVSPQCSGGQWFDIVVWGWGGGLLSTGGGLVAMLTGVGAVGGAVSFSFGMGATGWAFADTISCLVRGTPAAN